MLYKFLDLLLFSRFYHTLWGAEAEGGREGEGEQGSGNNLEWFLETGVQVCVCACGTRQGGGGGGGGGGAKIGEQAGMIP